MMGQGHIRGISMSLVFAAVTAVQPGIAEAGERFQKVVEAFDGAAPMTWAALSMDSAWSGYCVNASDEIDDAMLATRSADDPLMGPEVRAHLARMEGSSNYFVRMDEKTAREYVENTDPSMWTPGTWIDGELYLQALDRFRTILRQARTSKPSGSGGDTYYVAVRKCRSMDGIRCNASGNVPFITHEACYFYARNF
jgi:hypothetical protein